MRMIWTLARRELRSGTRGVRIVLACLALGVGAIAAVGSLRAAIDDGLATDSRRILGGDLEVQSGAQPLPDTLRDWLRGRGAVLSDIVTMRSMLIAPSGERQLVELKAVDGAYPLVGAAAVTPGVLSAGLADAGVVLEPVVLERLGVRPGDRLKLGQAQVVVRGTLMTEPDRAASPTILGPRALIGLATLPATALVQPGSLLNYDLRATFPPGADVPGVMAALRVAFPEQGWRLRTAAEAAPAAARLIEQTSLFLTLVGLSALLVGGIGVSTGIRAWLEARARTIATLRCLGATTGTIFGTILIEVGALALLGVLAGVAVGAVLPLLATWAFGDQLPVPPRLGVYPRPLALAAVYGMLTAAAFALWPLARASQIPGAALFRDALLPARVQARPALLAGNALLVLALVALVVLNAEAKLFALWFCVGAGLTVLLFWGGGAVIMAGARRVRVPGAPAWARLGLSNLHRPGAGTVLMLVSLGLGLSTLASIALIQGNLRVQVLNQLPAQAPTFFFVDIQDAQLEQFKTTAAAQGATRIAEVPSLRARLVSVNGTPADQVQATPDTQWALRGDRGLTYSAMPPEGSRIVAGTWWPADYDGPPLVSFDANLAKGWGVGLGDTLRVNVLGRDIDLKIASLREIAWRSLSLNFTMVASPGLLARAPHTHLATVYADAGHEAGVLRAVTDALPNVSGIRVADVLGAVAALVGKLGTALAATGSVTLVSGALVLVGAIAAGQRRRMGDAVVLKTLGATRAQIRAAWLVEFGLIGAVAGVLAALVGTLASWGVVHFVMRADWVFLPGTLATVVLGCTALMLVFGYAGTAAALRAPAGPFLRQE